MSNILSRQGIYQKPGRHSALPYFLLIFIFFINCFPVVFAAPDAMIVKVGTYENEPKIFTSPEGRPSGMFIDIIEYIAKKEGWNLEYVPGTWSEGLQRLARGEIDFMPDVAYTAQRAKIFDFHKTPVMSSWFQAYARKGSGIQSLLDLKEKRIALLDQSVQQEAFIRFSEGFGLNTSLITVPDYKTMFEIVAQGKADAAITNQFYGIMHARKYGLVDTAVVFEPSSLFFATAKGTNKQLLNTIDRHLAKMKTDSQSIYYQTMKRWTSEQVGFRFPLWLKIFGLVVSIILLISIGGSIILKRQVNARTYQLRLSEKKYREIFDNSSMGIYQSTPDGRYINVNPALAHIFGYETPAAMIAGIKDIQNEVYVDPAERLKLMSLFAGGKTVRGFPLEYKRRDGSHFWISLHGKAVYDEEGKISHYEGTIEDITERKLAEIERVNQREKLEELVKVRTAELADAMKKAREADRLKSAFLATMSHELRTPLNSIIGFTGILAQKLAGPLNDEQIKQLGMVSSSARHLLELINDVLDISKIEAGQATVIFEKFNLPASIEKIVKTVLPLAEKKNLKINVAININPETIESDQRRVEQILLNLLNNAIKFTEKGSVSVKCEEAGEKIIISVVDTGIGIKDEDMGKLFNAFQQIDSGITRRYEGTGLGLSICKKLGELLGGEITVTSTWGKGSTFSFVLPRQKTPPGSAQ